MILRWVVHGAAFKSRQTMSPREFRAYNNPLASTGGVQQRPERICARARGLNPAAEGSAISSSPFSERISSLPSAQIKEPKAGYLLLHCTSPVGRWIQRRSVALVASPLNAYRYS